MADLLCLSPSFSPETTPTAIRASKILTRLSARWKITVLTESGEQQPNGPVRVEVVAGWRPRRLLAALRRLRLAKLLELVVWPDESVFWVFPAILVGRRIVRETEPSAITVFMMPYSAGLAGIALSRLTRLPLILNLDDSPTCTDMHSHFPTRLHYRLARALEDLYARCSDAIVYVSQTNLELVRARQPEPVRERFHLVRYGAEPEDFQPRSRPAIEHAARPVHPADGRNGVLRRRQDADGFEIAYVGAMTGWWSLIEQAPPANLIGRAYEAWERLGRYELARLDQRTSSPAIIGQAIIDAIAEHPDWAGRIRMAVYGNPYPDAVVARALASAGVQGVVSVFGPRPHEQVADIVARADLLFLTLPKRLDNSPGGRISAKTYEYLMTDRPILAAVSEGENRSYLANKPGVWLTAPDDRPGMKEVIAELAEAKFVGRPRVFDRERLHEELSYETRAAEFAAAIRAGIEHNEHKLDSRDRGRS